MAIPWRRAPPHQPTSRNNKGIGGGGGNRTRVRKHSPFWLYMLVPCFVVIRRVEHEHPLRRTIPDSSRRGLAGPSPWPAHFFDGAIRRHGLGSGSPARLSRFRRRARAQRCRWRLLRCPFFIEVRASPACAQRFVALVETGSPP